MTDDPVQVLETERARLQALLAVIEEEQRALLTLEVDKLEDIAERKRLLVNAGESGMRRLQACLPQQSDAKLLAARDRYVATARKALARNNQNAELVARQRPLIEQKLNLLAMASGRGGGTFYGADGQVAVDAFSRKSIAASA